MLDISRAWWARVFVVDVPDGSLFLDRVLRVMSIEVACDLALYNKAKIKRRSKCVTGSNCWNDEWYAHL